MGMHHDDTHAESYGTPPAASRLVNIALAFWSSRMLLCADEAGIFTALAGGPADSDTLSARLGLRPEATADFLRGLAELGLIARDDGLYRNTDDGALFLDRAAPHYIGPWLAMARATLHESPDLAASLREPASGGAAMAASPLEKMWSDVDDVLRATILKDGL